MKPALTILACLIAAGAVAAADRVADSPATAPAAAIPPTAASQPAGAVSLNDVITIEPVLSHQPAQPGQTLWLALEFMIKDDFRVYAVMPGSDVIPLRIRPAEQIPSATGGDPSAAVAAGEALYPPATELALPGQPPHQVYAGHFDVFVPITISPQAQAGGYTLRLTIRGQACNAAICLPPFDAALEVKVQVGLQAAPWPAWTSRFQDPLGQARTLRQWQQTYEISPYGAAWASPAPDLAIWSGLGLAFLAGLILNIMPCVLPVIPLKLLSILQQAKQSARRFEIMGLLYAAGIVLFFVLLAGLNAGLRAAGYGFHWGDHFRYPQFVIGMALLMVALAMNLFGLYTVLAPKAVASIQPRQGYLGSLGAGLLTALLSTPCSFAILTFAFAWTLAQPLWLGTIGILVIGLGMASPYALLTAFPSLVARVPKAGLWTDLFKKSMGFVMLLVAAWLLGTQMQEAYPAWIIAYAVVLAFCLWMWGSWLSYDAPAGRKWSLRALALALAVAAGVLMLTPAKPLATRFEEYDQAAFTAARAADKVVLVDFTASWCLTCKTVEQTVYNDPEVAKAIQAQGVLALRGDVSRRDSPAYALLNQLREPGVPVTAVFAPGSPQPIRLYGIFKKADLLDALTKARSPASRESGR
jgi:thiol:disulfide interchange protein